jgi:HlyD family type I secretion membrane fusion protein
MVDRCSAIDQWHRDVPHSARWPIALGVFVVLAWGLGFGSWAALAPLQGAVVASGSFVATGQNKQVQHLEGGIIRDMRVREGDRVEANQLLLQLDDTAAKAKLRRLILRQYRLFATKARLEAEINSLDKLRLPLQLTRASDPEVKAIIAGQEIELAARRNKLLTEEEVLKREIAGLQESIRGYQAQVASNRERLDLFAQEIKDKRSLLERQLIRKTEVLNLQRSEAGLSGDLGELLGRIGDSKERIARADQQIAQLRSTAIQKALEDLRATETELDDVGEQIRGAQDVVERTDVRAPVHGIVVKVHRHTIGGVVGAGEVILELLPTNDDLIIEARVNPREITHVKAGQAALVRMTALNQRLTPMVQGTVMYVSADAVSDSKVRPGDDATASKGQSFIVRVALDERDMHSKIEGFRATPGMPADLYIKTGERTFFNYVMRPVFDSFSRAFREQ